MVRRIYLIRRIPKSTQSYPNYPKPRTLVAHIIKIPRRNGMISMKDRLVFASLCSSGMRSTEAMYMNPPEAIQSREGTILNAKLDSNRPTKPPAIAKIADAKLYIIAFLTEKPPKMSMPKSPSS